MSAIGRLRVGPFSGEIFSIRLLGTRFIMQADVGKTTALTAPIEVFDMDGLLSWKSETVIDLPACKRGQTCQVTYSLGITGISCEDFDPALAAAIVSRMGKP
jgi:hypothetical protein